MGTRDPFKVGGGKKDKKIRKGRLDKYYYLAKEQGYRSRAAFKLIQLNKKYDVFKTAKIVLDLCAAPGGWLQVARKAMPAASILIGVDLAPIKSLHNVISIQEDITTSACKMAIKTHIHDWKIDVVLHDGSPNMGQAWAQDAFTQAELVLKSLELAAYFLRPGGTFISKVFRSADYNALLYVFNQLFAKVEVTKPPASRNTSAEIYVICSNFLSFNKIDPKLFNPKYTFQELAVGGTAASGLITAKKQDIFNTTQKRFREGYDELNPTLYKSTSILDFIRSVAPIDILSQYNKFEFKSNTYLHPNPARVKNESSKEELEIELKNIDRIFKHPETKPEIKSCLDDLRVLGKKDFKNILKWRITIREAFADLLPSNTEEDEKNKKEPKSEDKLKDKEKVKQEKEEGQDETSEESGGDEEGLTGKQLKDKIKRKKEKRRRKEAKKRQEASTGLGIQEDFEHGEGQGKDELFDIKQIQVSKIPRKPNDLMEIAADLLTEEDLTSGLKQKKGKKGDKLKRLEKLAREKGQIDGEQYEDVVDDLLDEMYNSFLKRQEKKGGGVNPKNRSSFASEKGIKMGWEEDLGQSEEENEELQRNEEEHDDIQGEQQNTLLVKEPGASSSKPFINPIGIQRDEEKKMNLWFANSLFTQNDQMDLDQQPDDNDDNDDNEEEEQQQQQQQQQPDIKLKKEVNNNKSNLNKEGGVISKINHKNNVKVIEEPKKVNKKRKRTNADAKTMTDDPEGSGYEIVPKQTFGNESSDSSDSSDHEDAKKKKT